MSTAKKKTKPKKFDDMTVREFARHAHEQGGKATLEIRPPVSDDRDDARQAMQAIVSGVEIIGAAARGRVAVDKADIDRTVRNVERLDAALGRMERTIAEMERTQKEVAGESLVEWTDRFLKVWDPRAYRGMNHLEAVRSFLTKVGPPPVSKIVLSLARAEGFREAAKMVAAKSDLLRGTRGGVNKACFELDLTTLDLETAARKLAGTEPG